MMLAADTDDPDPRVLAAAGGLPTETSAGFDAPMAGVQQCFLPDWLRVRRAWGLAIQLYELRSARNWGIGDFADLTAMAGIAAAAGADFIGLNPLHALFVADPARCSPFSPSSRRFLNPLYIAVDKVEGFDAGMVDATALERLRAESLVDYAGVASLKLGVLRRIWNDVGCSATADLADFRQRGGLPLERHAVFEALSEAMTKQGHGSGWHAWPLRYRSCDDPAVAAFAQSNARDVGFHLWLQWLARRQLTRAADTALGAGMRIGLYLDFAVGEAPDGSATWSDPDMVVRGMSIGAPPDVFSADGQDWGLAPLSPARLSADGFSHYRSLMEAVLEGAGALRIDHAMSLRHLFWIPHGKPAADGAFVRYPMRGMLDVLGTASQQAQALVIGEDLGHVPEGFREQMAEAGILSYRILYFEQDAGRFVTPRRWPALALACLSTHDLPTLRGWWAGSDIALRREHELIGSGDAEAQTRQRHRERRNLLTALRAAGLMPKRDVPDSAPQHDMVLDRLTIAAHRFIARTPARLAAMRLADAVGERHPTNLPGVADGYPNWRRKLAVAIEDLPSHRLFRDLTAAMANERPR